MIIPEFLKPGDTLGVTAPSHPIDKEEDQYRFRNAKAKLRKHGYKVIFTDNVFVQADRYGRSGDGRSKAEEFNNLVNNPSVKGIYSAAGGDFLSEMLPYVDLEAFKKNPKWVQGYSDNTSLLYYLTTKGDIATAYGANFSDFGMQNWDVSVRRGLEVLEGKCLKQTSFDAYQNGFGERSTGLEGYSKDTEVEWKCVCGQKHEWSEVIFRGRLIGGCMDVVLNLAGTPYDGTAGFLEKYKDDGIIWYLESFDLHFEQMMEGLWKMREMGWFDHVSGFVFGRPLFYPTETWDGMPLPAYEEVLEERLGELGVPVIADADIGHKGPQFVMINGRKAQVRYAGGRGSVKYLPE